MAPANDNLPTIISIKEAARLPSLSRPYIVKLRNEGRFPVAVTLGEKRIGFVRAEVMEWIEDRISARQVAA